MMSDKITDRQRKILFLLVPNKKYAASDIVKLLDDELSSASLRRDLVELVSFGLLVRQGEFKASKYQLRNNANVFTPFEIGKYYTVDELSRGARQLYNTEIIQQLSSENLFTPQELDILHKATDTFKKNAENLSSGLFQKELERFVVEFSWKSSKIEGNTYSLLDTEFLLRQGIEAKGKSKFDAKMILNHKSAYLFVMDLVRDDPSLSRGSVETVHKTLISGLGVETGIRSRMVGISGTLYKPLSIKQQILEQLSLLENALADKKINEYQKALMAVLCISYLQPLEDGNKRTSRVIANAVLLANKLAPISYRSVDEKEYKEATLIFYEQNSVVPFKKLFIEQYVFSANNYNIARIGSSHD